MHFETPAQVTSPNGNIPTKEDLAEIERRMNGRAVQINVGPRGLADFRIRGTYIGIFDVSGSMRR